MALNQDENVCCGIKFDDAQRNILVDFDGFESDDGRENIVDLLPNDPFGMDYKLGLPNNSPAADFDISLPGDPFGMDFDMEVTVAAITDWIEDFGLDACGFEADEASEVKNGEDNDFFAELNFVWTSSVEYGQEVGENEVVDAGLWKYSKDGLHDDHNMSSGVVDDSMCFGCEIYQNENVKDDDDGGAPPDALFFALGYLGVRDLLAVERVCKSLCDAVRNDPLLWRNIHIDYPLSDKITNDTLLRLTNRAQGTLSSLSLVKCLKITNIALKHVLESNPRLTKLSVPGCIKLSVEGILHDLKVFNSVALPGIKHLRIGELLGLTNHHFKEFKLLLGANEDSKSSNYKPRFYHARSLYLSLDDDDDERAIDIETCPRCQQARQVYDCPAESCQAETHSAKACRACIFCVSRCLSCGCCLDNKAYEETFCLDLLCLDCLDQLFNCQDGVRHGPKYTYIQQMATYHFFLYS